jgi:electron transport complex protein RnfB
MHTVIAPLCTGCELCLPACPVDCIVLSPASDMRTGWQAWSPAEATRARERYAAHRMRLARERDEEARRLAASSPTPGSIDDPVHRLAGADVPSARAKAVEAALARARERRSAG